MMSAIAKFDTLSTRAGFNSVVRHVKATISHVEAVSSKINLSDSFFSSSSEELDSERMRAILRMTLVDKFGYAASSRNLSSVCENFDPIAEEISRWNAVDLVIAYHHPDLGLLAANPKDKEQLAAFGTLRKRELAIAYAGKHDKTADALCATAAELALSLLEGASPAIPATLYKGDCVYKKARKQEPAAAPRKKAAPSKAAKVKATPAKAEAAAPTKAVPAAPAASIPGTARRMTPMYSVVVQNELFHNGNVEAWKRIIDSYKTKHPNLEVYIYYDGERILNLNSLFKWGKVKHGSSIQFAVAGEDIKDVAKLQRYLIQGASHQFEAFLHGPVSTALKLF
jgi:hypothetical protein